MVLRSLDLMIGDWIYRPDCYDQVKEIRHTGVIGIDSMRGLIAFSELEPIPLTPEILEKNGFKKFNFRDIERQHEWTWWEDTLTNVSLWCRELDDKVDDGWMVRIESPISSLCVKVVFLHELQHALRLCGIDKTIEL